MQQREERVRARGPVLTGPHLARELVEGLRLAPEEVEREDRLRRRQVVPAFRGRQGRTNQIKSDTSFIIAISRFV